MKFSMRLTLIAVIIGLIWVTYAFTTSTTYLSSEKTLRRHARDVMDNISSLAMQEAYTHLKHAEAAAVLTHRLISSDVIAGGRETLNMLEQYFYNHMEINPHFAGIYLGMPDGSFYDVRRSDDRVKQGYRSKFIEFADNGERRTRLLWHDDSFQLIADDNDPDDTFDPRDRPWYINALKKKQIVWTDPYIFYSSQKPGITISGPSFDSQGQIKGIIGVDIEIDQLSTFIASLKIGVNGSAFMLNRNGDVVAHPDLDKLRTQPHPDRKEHRLVKIEELDDAVSREAYLSLTKNSNATELANLNQSELAKFRFEGRDYIAMITPFNRWEWPWFIYVFLPEDDFLGGLKENRKLNMMIAFLISLLATAIGLYLARSIIRPISALEAEATAIRNGNFDTKSMTLSPYTELQSTTDSFQLMKDAVQASHQRFQGIFEHIQDAYFETTMEGKILELSPSFEKLYGWERGQLIGKSIAYCFVEADRFENLKEELFREGKCDDFLADICINGGSVANGSINAERVHATAEHPEKIIGSLRDITRRREAEQKLEGYHNHLEEEIGKRTRDLENTNKELTREIERRRQVANDLLKREEEYYNLYHLNRRVTNNVPELIWAKDFDGRYILANQAMCDKLLKCSTPEEAIGHKDLHFASLERQNGHKHTFGEICVNSDEITLEKKNAGRFLEDGLVRGVYLALDVYKAPFFDESGELIGTVGCGRDVTKEKLMEKELQFSEERFRELFKNTSDLIHSLDRDGNFIMVNKAWCRTLKYTENEIVGQSTSRIIDPADRGRFNSLSERLLNGVQVENLETVFIARDGERVHVVGNITPRMIDGKLVETHAIFHNISEQKELEARLRRAQKMEALGILAGGVAHDINNVLSGIVSYPDLLLMQVPDDSPLRGPLTTIRESGKKAAEIVQDLLTLARRGVMVEHLVELNDVITQYFKDPEFQKLKTYHPEVKVERNLEPDLFNIAGSRMHLSKTVMNLVSNAAEAMPKGGTLSITTENRYIDRPVSGYESIEEGDYVILTVSDNGIGIGAADKERIFEPFYTKKTMGRSGTGLGMAVVWGTVKDHHGYIDVAGTEGKGTTLTLYFPANRKTADKDKDQAPLEAYRGKGESILVIDDVAGQREIATSLLRALGYSVHEVPSGEEAVEYVRAHPVDLLILDMIMDPGIDGLETYSRIIKIRPGQKAVIASGFSETDRVRKAQDLGAGSYIKKPYTIDNLGAVIRRELDADD